MSRHLICKNLRRKACCSARLLMPLRLAPPAEQLLLTGQCPHNNGMLGLAHRGFFLNDYNQHIIHWLHPHGYRSTLIGLQHIAKDPRTIGYDDVVETGGMHVAQVAPAAARFLKQRPKQPFSLRWAFMRHTVSMPRPLRSMINDSPNPQHPFRTRPKHGETWPPFTQQRERWTTA